MKSRFTARDITLTAVFTAIMVVAAMLFRYTGPIVPISLQPFVVMLAGGIIGARLGSLSMVVYLLIGLVGVPVFAKAPFGGPAYVLMPTFGFLLGFAFSAYIIGFILERSETRSLARYIVAMMTGILVYDIVGVAYLYLMMVFYMGGSYSMMDILAIGFFPFLALDLLKGLAAAFLAMAVSKRLQGNV